MLITPYEAEEVAEQLLSQGVPLITTEAIVSTVVALEDEIEELNLEIEELDSHIVDQQTIIADAAIDYDTLTEKLLESEERCNKLESIAERAVALNDRLISERRDQIDQSTQVEDLQFFNRVAEEKIERLREELNNQNSEIRKLVEYIYTEFPGEPRSGHETAVDVAIRYLSLLKLPVPCPDCADVPVLFFREDCNTVWAIPATRLDCIKPGYVSITKAEYDTEISNEV